MVGASLIFVALTVLGALSLSAKADPTPSTTTAEERKRAEANGGQPEHNEPPPPQNIKGGAINKVLELVPADERAGVQVPREGAVRIFVARRGADQDPTLARAIDASGYAMIIVVVRRSEHEVLTMSDPSQWIAKAPESWSDKVSAVGFAPEINGVTLEVIEGWTGTPEQASALIGVPVQIRVVKAHAQAVLRG
ncbi:hypothetical protein AESSP_02183 [Aestuariimicrobium sp. T2.26MG-19.2B]|nr:hypothetical protein AESSP_02183 [Aestuariimicrobium sp. T2.26MG-19.2B]